MNAQLSQYLQTPRSRSWECRELVIILLIISSRLIRKTPVPTNCLSVIKRIITKPLWASNNPFGALAFIRSTEAAACASVRVVFPLLCDGKRKEKFISQRFAFQFPKEKHFVKASEFTKSQRMSLFCPGTRRRKIILISIATWGLGWVLFLEEMQDNWIFVNQGWVSLGSWEGGKKWRKSLAALSSQCKSRTAGKLGELF